MERGKRKANAMMRLRRKNSDASMLLPGWKAFSGVAALFIAVANLQVSQFAGVDNASNSQGHILRTSTCALTSGSSGPQTLSSKKARSGNRYIYTNWDSNYWLDPQ